MALAALEKLCETHSLFSSTMEQRPKFRKASKIPNLQIKCHDEQCGFKSQKNITSKNTTSSTKRKKEKFGISRESLVRKDRNSIDVSYIKRKGILQKLVQTSKNKQQGWRNSFKQFNNYMLMLNLCSQNMNIQIKIQSLAKTFPRYLIVEESLKMNMSLIVFLLTELKQSSIQLHSHLHQMQKFSRQNMMSLLRSLSS